MHCRQCVQSFWLQVHQITRAQQPRGAARTEGTVPRQHGDLTGGRCPRMLLPVGQHHAHDFELARLEYGAGGGLCQPVTQRKDTDDLARKGCG